MRSGYKTRLFSSILRLSTLVKHGYINYMTGLVGPSSQNGMQNNNLTAMSLGVICRLRRIQSSRYEIDLQMQSEIVAETTYTSLVSDHYIFRLVLS